VEMVRRILGKRVIPLWILLAGFYIFAQAALYAQDRQSPTPGQDTPWEHLTLEGALALAVAVQYRENRQKEAASTKLSTDAAAAITKATEIMEQVTAALERLSGKVERCPVRAAEMYPPSRHVD